MNMCVRDGVWKGNNMMEFSGEMSGKRLWSWYRTEEAMDE